MRSFAAVVALLTVVTSVQSAPLRLLARGTPDIKEVIRNPAPVDDGPAFGVDIHLIEELKKIFGRATPDVEEEIGNLVVVDNRGVPTLDDEAVDPTDIG